MINFAKIMADPCDSQYINPVDGANSASASTGDGLHPGDVGYEAMANAVPLGFVREGRRLWEAPADCRDRWENQKQYSQRTLAICGTSRL